MIGARLKEIRDKSGLKQKPFADRIGTSSSYISEIESGKKIPGGEFLVSLKREFGVDINWLLTGKEGREGAETGGRGDVERASLDEISPRSAKLLANFEALNEEDKRAIERLAFTVAECQKMGKASSSLYQENKILTMPRKLSTCSRK